MSEPEVDPARWTPTMYLVMGGIMVAIFGIPAVTNLDGLGPLEAIVSGIGSLAGAVWLAVGLSRLGGK